tara:strand:- start:2122 stop:3873 length:1752 start_codon:yes stop_codon:yes gene_type:complete
MNIETMIKSFYKQADEEKLVNEVLKFLLTEVAMGTPPKATFDWSMIPDIPISEIGWSDVSTGEEGEQILGPQRALLEQYLDNIGVEGGSFADQIASLEGFYKNGAAQIKKESGEDRVQLIRKLISYLVFYKTLTKVVTNFNAASAGFTFESFLATLMKGTQIPTNSNTIADFTTGENIPISLKLYAEKTLHVEGSFTDLVNDLVEPKYDHPDGNAMRYVLCTKRITGEGLKQKGTIGFYQFDFTLDNVFAILAASMEKSQRCIHLPLSFVKAVEGGETDAGKLDFSATLPAKDVLPSPEELEQQFVTIAKRMFDSLVPEEHELYPTPEEYEQMVNNIDFAKNDDLFTPVGKGDLKQVIRGQSAGVGPQKVARILKAVYDNRDEPPKKYPKGSLDFLAKNVFQAAYLEILNQYKASEMKLLRKQAITDTTFVTDVGELVGFYKGLDPATKAIALKNTLGYMETFQFALNRKQSTTDEAPIHTQKFGVLSIGGENVEKMLGQVSSILNDEIFTVFSALKELSDNLNGFFAGGLADDDKAKVAMEKAQEIETKTASARGSKGAPAATGPAMSGPEPASQRRYIQEE